MLTGRNTAADRTPRDQRIAQHGFEHEHDVGVHGRRSCELFASSTWVRESSHAHRSGHVLGRAPRRRQKMGLLRPPSSRAAEYPPASASTAMKSWNSRRAQERSTPRRAAIAFQPHQREESPPARGRQQQEHAEGQLAVSLHAGGRQPQQDGKDRVASAQPRRQDPTRGRVCSRSEMLPRAQFVRSVSGCRPHAQEEKPGAGAVPGVEEITAPANAAHFRRSSRSWNPR